MTKQAKAIEIVRQNADKARKDVIAIIREQLNMSDAGASTYYYNAKKALAEGEGARDQAMAEAASKAPKSAKKSKKSEKTAELAGETAEVTEADAPMTSFGADFESRRAAASKAIDDMLAQIDVNEIPAFLRRNKA